MFAQNVTLREFQESSGITIEALRSSIELKESQLQQIQEKYQELVLGSQKSSEEKEKLKITVLELESSLKEEKALNQQYFDRMNELQELVSILEQRLSHKYSPSYPETPNNLTLNSITVSDMPTPGVDRDEINLISQFENVLGKMKSLADSAKLSTDDEFFASTRTYSSDSIDPESKNEENQPNSLQRCNLENDNVDIDSSIISRTSSNLIAQARNRIDRAFSSLSQLQSEFIDFQKQQETNEKEKEGCRISIEQMESSYKTPTDIEGTEEDDTDKENKIKPFDLRTKNYGEIGKNLEDKKNNYDIIQLKNKYVSKCDISNELVAIICPLKVKIVHATIELNEAKHALSLIQTGGDNESQYSQYSQVDENPRKIDLLLRQRLNAIDEEVLAEKNNNVMLPYVSRLTARLDMLTKELDHKSETIRTITNDNISMMTRIQNFEDLNSQKDQEIASLIKSKDVEIRQTIDENNRLRNEVLLLEDMMKVRMVVET
jgi:hypothetical protein